MGSNNRHFQFNIFSTCKDIFKKCIILEDKTLLDEACIIKFIRNLHFKIQSHSLCFLLKTQRITRRKFSRSTMKSNVKDVRYTSVRTHQINMKKVIDEKHKK